MIPKWKILPNYLGKLLFYLKIYFRHNFNGNININYYFKNINALIHPSLLYGHLCNWDGKSNYEKEIELYFDINENHEKILIE